MKIMKTIKKLLGVTAPPKTMDRKKFFELEIARWKFSKARMDAITGERYYEGIHDILKKKRTVIGNDGELEEVKNLPNNKVVDNKFAELVDQKSNYLLSKPITFETGNDKFDEELTKVFNASFLNKLKNGGVDALCGGVFWLYVYYNEKGELAFQRFKPYEVLPFWKDSEHTELDCAVRLYPVEVYEGERLEIVEKVEIFTVNGIERYELKNGRLIEDVENSSGHYAYIGEQGFNWEQVPLVCFKANAKEISLITRVKGLQDALNDITNNLLNAMQQDVHNTVLVIKNYDGQNLAEFRKNLATYGAVKVRTVDGGDGDVSTLQIDVNAQNYELVLKCLKKSIIENGRGFDAKDDRLGSNANQMNLRSMYASIDLDADNMEAEFKVSFEKLMFFVKAYLATKNLGSFDDNVRITFNRDIIVSETEIIDNMVKLGVQLPNELLVGQMPFVDNVKDVMEMLKKEREEQVTEYQSAFPQQPDVNDEGLPQ